MKQQVSINIFKIVKTYTKCEISCTPINGKSKSTTNININITNTYLHNPSGIKIKIFIRVMFRITNFEKIKNVWLFIDVQEYQMAITLHIVF